MILLKLENNAKLLLWIYLAAMLLLVVLPINGEKSSLNNNYSFGIRWDYLIHSIVYIPLPILLSLNKKINFWIGILIALILASGFELLQMALSYRAFNINDLMANLIGVGLGILAMFIFQFMNLNPGT
jgi:glycopeptide antibiotics resistance protein